ncbi:MAG: adenosylcobinamide-GDP ribazoletransferase [Tannerellaceae bacterium]
MKKELNIFYNALLFFSRIPVPRNLEFSEEIQTKAFRYFPLVGIIVGGIGVAAFEVADLFFSRIIATILMIIVMLLTTGCLHEDGLADFFDGFGGGTSKERILAIMKDSHIGTYGVIALIMLFVLKVALLSHIYNRDFIYVIIAAQAFSRLSPMLLINTSQYARTEPSKGQFTRNKIDLTTLIVGLLFGLLPLIFFNAWFIVSILTVTTLFFFCYRRYLHKKIDGFTGDTLGALQQFGELLFYLVFTATQYTA